MVVGCVKEIKKHEYRVGLNPACVREFIRAGHKVLIESGAGLGSNFPDVEYIGAGAEMCIDAKYVYSHCDMIVKVKEPLSSEYSYLRENQILFTFLHLAANKQLTEVLVDKRVTAIAYETIELEDGSLPCLKPMSVIAGRLSVQEGAKYLESHYGGCGILLGGFPGVKRGKIAVLGGGVVGYNATLMALGLGADVTVLDINQERLNFFEDKFFGKITTLYSNRDNILKTIKNSDLIIGAVLVHGAKAPWLIKREDYKYIKRGTVIVDVAVDQGGCIETTHPTTYDDPTFILDGVVNYCVANMPGSVACTSTNALIHSTQKYGLSIASKGLEGSLKLYPELIKGVNTHGGELTNKNVSTSLDLEFKELSF